MSTPLGFIGATLVAMVACQSAPPVRDVPEPVTPPVETSELRVDAPPDVAVPPADAITTRTGLTYKVLSRGSGAVTPTAADTVTVYYVGWTTDGAMFDSRVRPEQPVAFPLRSVIAGWTEGLQLMREGDQFRFWMPKELAYNDHPGRPAGMLVFDVELVDIHVSPGAPAEVGAVPVDATRTASGLAYKVLRAGNGGARPSATSTVTVHYAGWTTDGKLIDSSRDRGQPATFPLSAVIPGWTEAVQLMDVGSEMRFWIPEELAYKGAGGGAPQGMLVFDIELLSFN